MFFISSVQQCNTHFNQMLFLKHKVNRSQQQNKANHVPPVKGFFNPDFAVKIVMKGKKAIKTGG